MPADLFSTPYDIEQEQLGKAMHQAWMDDLDLLMRSGRVPPWIEMDTVLQKDEMRMLQLVEDNCGYLEKGEVSKSYGVDASGLIPVDIVRRVDQLTDDAGFTAQGNALAVVNRCIAEGWLERNWSAPDNCNRLDLTEKGRWYMDMVEYDKFWEDMVDDHSI